MTPDGFPIVGGSKSVSNLINAVGMCGQGFMLGPGMGELVSRMALDTCTAYDMRVLQSFDPMRSYTGEEAFK